MEFEKDCKGQIMSIVNLRRHVIPFDIAYQKYNHEYLQKKDPPPYGVYPQIAHMLPFIFDDRIIVDNVYVTGDYDDDQGEIIVYYKFLIVSDEMTLYFRCCREYGSCHACSAWRDVNTDEYTKLIDFAILEATSTMKTTPFTDEEMKSSGSGLYCTEGESYWKPWRK